MNSTSWANYKCPQYSWSMFNFFPQSRSHHRSPWVIRAFAFAIWLKRGGPVVCCLRILYCIYNWIEMGKKLKWKKTFFIHNAQLPFFHIRIKCPETFIRSSFLINPSRGVTRVAAAIKYRLWYSHWLVLIPDNSSGTLFTVGVLNFFFLQGICIDSI